MKIVPAEGLHCAIPPDGKIDPDMVRRGAAGAQYVAGQVEGKPWPALARLGWRTIPVRIVYAGASEEQATIADPPQPPPLEQERPSGFSGTERISAKEYRRLVGADNPQILRCGRGKREVV